MYLINTEGVREYQPRVELWQPWETHLTLAAGATLTGLRRSLTNTFFPRVA